MAHKPAPNEYQLTCPVEDWGHELPARQPRGPWTLVAYDNRTDELVERRTHDRPGWHGSWARQQALCGRSVWIVDPTKPDPVGGAPMTRTPTDQSAARRAVRHVTPTPRPQPPRRR